MTPVQDQCHAQVYPVTHTEVLQLQMIPITSLMPWPTQHSSKELVPAASGTARGLGKQEPELRVPLTTNLLSSSKGLLVYPRDIGYTHKATSFQVACFLLVGEAGEDYTGLDVSKSKPSQANKGEHASKEH